MNEEQIGYLICETSPVEEVAMDVIKDNGEWIEFTTVLQDADVINRNNRLYERSAIDSGIKEPHFIERMKTGNLFGEAGHPLEPTVKRQMYLDQTRMSHCIRAIWWDGPKLMGNLYTANTLVGKDQAGLIRQGTIPAFSMRGMGPVAVKDNGFLRVKKPLTIFTYDWILFPSHASAYMTSKGAFKETVNKSINEGSALIAESGLFKEIKMKNLQKSVSNYIKENSKRVRLFSEQFGFEYEELKVDKNGQVFMEDSYGDKALIDLEVNIKRELQNTLLEFK